MFSKQHLLNPIKALFDFLETFVLNTSLASKIAHIDILMFLSHWLRYFWDIDTASFIGLIMEVSRIICPCQMYGLSTISPKSVCFNLLWLYHNFLMYSWVLYAYIRHGGFISTDATVRSPRFHRNDIWIGVERDLCVHESVIFVFMSRNTDKHVATILYIYIYYLIFYTT